MKPYEGMIKNAFAENDQAFLLEMIRYAPAYEEEHIEDTMIELNICPNCASKLEVKCDDEPHGEQFRYRKCTVCHWE